MIKSEIVEQEGAEEKVQKENARLPLQDEGLPTDYYLQVSVNILIPLCKSLRQYYRIN